MKDELVTFITAKLAKEKGFDIPTIEYWYSNLEDKWNYFEMTALNSERYNHNEDGFKAISSPTQNLLQKWLREKHDIQIEITFDTISYGFKTWHLDNLNDSYTYEFEMYTYEQALEQALIKGLKLIK